MFGSMTLAYAERLGRVHGEDIAASILSEDTTLDGETFGDVLSETVEHFRQYSPFEFYARDINAREHRYEGGAEDGWARYEDGFSRGVRVACRRAGRSDLI